MVVANIRLGLERLVRRKVRRPVRLPAAASCQLSRSGQVAHSTRRRPIVLRRRSRRLVRQLVRDACRDVRQRDITDRASSRRSFRRTSKRAVDESGECPLLLRRRQHEEVQAEPDRVRSRRDARDRRDGDRRRRLGVWQLALFELVQQGHADASDGRRSSDRLGQTRNSRARARRSRRCASPADAVDREDLHLAQERKRRIRSASSASPPARRPSRRVRSRARPLRRRGRVFAEHARHAHGLAALGGSEMIASSSRVRVEELERRQDVGIGVRGIA